MKCCTVGRQQPGGGVADRLRKQPQWHCGSLVSDWGKPAFPVCQVRQVKDAEGMTVAYRAAAYERGRGAVAKPLEDGAKDEDRKHLAYQVLGSRAPSL
jgi:hypothetical protein